MAVSDVDQIHDGEQANGSHSPNGVVENLSYSVPSEEFPPNRTGKHFNGFHSGHSTRIEDQSNGNDTIFKENPSTLGTAIPSASNANDTTTPIAICGMALRLPGGLESPQDLWQFLLAKGDARSRVPESRYNISAYHSESGKPGTIATEYGYFLDESVKLGSLDASRFSLSRAELEFSDPQQRRMLEVVREAFDDAGENSFKGRTIGCYMGSYGEDWLEMQNRDHQQSGVNRVDGYSDFMLSSRISYEMDLKGPCMTVRTACSAALIGLNEACQAIQNGLCEAAVIGGANLIMAPGMTAFMTEKGVLSPDGHCKTFSADANGYARGESITAIFIKPLEAAIRDGNPVRAVLRSVVSNSDGRTPGIAQPSTESQEALMRKAYSNAGISDYSKTAFVECHGTGTPVGDPIETNAVARVFGDAGVYIGSVKPNLGHSEGASGLTSLIKAVLSLENRVIPPNIKFTCGNAKIPFKERKLTVPLEAVPWPVDRFERVSVNSFGIGGSNAHAILDSARSFNLPFPTTQSIEPSSLSKEDRLHLLVLSASSSASLQRMVSDYRTWIDHNADRLGELAYTLANRREHLPYRAYMTASPERLPDAASQGTKVSNQPNLVMVFTGQGAQWPRMGRELLLREDLIFRDSIRSLDRYLMEVPNAPQWTIEEELSKPARKSGVQKAELSQPLCTAIQIALVDLFRSIGIKPKAVVGHSSGEIAAGYAAGALSAKEAIIIAWQRGIAAKEQKRPGAMAAIGLGRQDVSKHLLSPKVVIACENSPRSVTISGDSDEVNMALERIQKENTNITARLLKVDKAYHSYHMSEVGDFYTRSLREYLPSLGQEKVPFSISSSDPERHAQFFSSVSGKREPMNTEELGGDYWQKNLESSVLFMDAVEGVIRNLSNVVFLEIGPHPALAGPVRQTIAASVDAPASPVPYLGAMNRGEDCVASFLTAVGRLFELNNPIDFTRITTKATSVAGLPHYPWDHSANYWRESRISHEWRYRKFPSHPLLGIRQLESTTLEPSFRNMLLLSDTPWLRDHCIEGNVIFPCAGYVSMIGEGIRQIATQQQENIQGERSFTIRNMVLNSALLLTEDKPAELVTTFRPVRLTDSLDSQWWHWTVASHNGYVWTKHCSGEATCEEGVEPEIAPDTTQLPRKVDGRKYYSVLSRAGIEYGPKFQRLSCIRTGTLESISTAKLSNSRCGDEAHYHLHPAVIDGCIQSGPLAATRGHIEAKNYRRVPTKIDRIVVHRVDLDISLSAAASSVFIKGSGEVVSRVQCIANGKVVLDMQGARLSPLEEAAAAAPAGVTEEDGEKGGPLRSLNEELITSRLTWAPHIDFLNVGNLIKPEVPRHLYTPLLDRMVRLCFVYSQKCIQRLGDSDALPVSLPVHVKKYMDWIDSQVALENNMSIKNLEDTSLLEQIKDLEHQMEGTPVEDCAAAIEKIRQNISGICSGTTDPLEMLLADGTLTKIYVATDACDRSDFVRHLAHSKPNLRILEIGAGTGASTASLLSHLILPVGQPMYSKYTFTDISAGFFPAAKERFRGYKNIDYRVLDISKDPAEQAFAEDEKYDLVIATNVLHATKSLKETLRNVHKLLDHRDGRLLLHELDSPSKWPNYIFGTLAGWWYGEPDGRSEQPYVTPERWERELREAGFDGLETVIRDAEVPHQLNAIMVAKPTPRTTRDRKCVTLLASLQEPLADIMITQLENRGYIVHRHQLEDDLPEFPSGQDILSLLDVSHPFFENIEESQLATFQRLINGISASGNGMLWITPTIQVACKDPRFAQTIGTFRTIRTESLLDLATCEVDDLAASIPQIADVFDRFQTRPRLADEAEEGEALDLKPDYEYAIVNQVVTVGRVYPVSLTNEPSNHNHHDDANVALTMTKPGRLSTLFWERQEGDGTVALNNEDVEIQVYAAGLNFKDVLGGLGVVPYPEAGLGLEGSGVVSRIGPGVKNLQLGDRVMFLADGSFATRIVTPEQLCEKIPTSLSFEDAATMPAVFATALRSLFGLGNLRKGQSVLIHSAGGGVGLAAIQLANMVGAQIYATVGSEEKAQYLSETFGLARDHIFNSRDASFFPDLMRVTDGRGVDLALNSLSGELLHATWRCVAEFGKLVEIGKRDFLGGGKLDMDVFLASRSYCCFYLDAEMARRRPLVKETLQEVVRHLRMGHITPITPKRVFDASAIQQGFRHLQQGTHIGKIVFSMREADGNIKCPTRNIVNPTPKLQLDSSASFLLVGGLGGLGRAVARHLVAQGARHIVFLSRSAGSGPEDYDTIQELESMGCKISMVRGSVVSKDDVSSAISQAPNLSGIIQASMVLRDENFSRLSFNDWSEAVAPKVQGTWNLHHAVNEAGIQLDFFVLFSSMSGVTGQAGQANYAGANTFMDSFVQYRNGLGLACSALDIGAVQDVGHVSQDEALLERMKAVSAHGITEPELMQALTSVILLGRSSRKVETPSSHVAYVDKNTIGLGLSTNVPLATKESRAFWRKDRRFAAYHNNTRALEVEIVGGKGSDGLKQFLSRAKSDVEILRKEESAKFLAREVGKKLFSFLLRSDDDLDTSVSLTQLGMDSLVGVEMRSWWRQAFGFDISVLELLGMGNLEGLGTHAAEGLLELFGKA